MSNNNMDWTTDPAYKNMAGNSYHKTYSHNDVNNNSEPLLTAKESKSAVGGLFWGIVITGGLVYGLAWLSSILN